MYTHLAYLVALWCFCCCSAQFTQEQYRAEFSKFGKTYKKNYLTVSEENHRYAVFKQHLDFIAECNDPRHERTMKLSINKFADRTHEEFRQDLLHRQQFYGAPASAMFDEAPPDSWDWRTQSACVGPVEDQGQMADAAAIEFVNSVESCVCIATSKLESLSVQQVVDCCSDVDQLDYFQCVLKTTDGALDTAQCYPETDKEQTCNYQSSCCGGKFGSYGHVPSGNETALQAAVYQTPVWAAIDGGETSFIFYSSGVYNDPRCSATQLDHAVLIVGYGYDTKSRMDYWIAKNSWGVDWGMNGYILIARNKNNACGIASDALYPEQCGPC